ncbi:NAD(P)-binding domain-containing protein, partial [Akkermansiaceae bacterium]|nr:NAD(P)-binding domain-containing protein [Akkermansiaceae bacterium]
PVDAVIKSLMPLLDPDDIIIDGGNSLYTDTERRDKYVGEAGFRFIGAGVSGGEEGALKGPSIMPGGPASTWEVMKPIFESISAKVDGEPCVVHIGEGGAGHFVKMVHNGIEYGDMQLICEAYNIFKAAGFTNEELADIFSDWNAGDLESFLIEITANIFKQTDPETGKHIVDLVVDKAGQKGTGRWTILSHPANSQKIGPTASCRGRKNSKALRLTAIVAVETVALVAARRRISNSCSKSCVWSKRSKTSVAALAPSSRCSAP